MGTFQVAVIRSSVDILIDRTLPKKQIMEQIQGKTKEIYARYYNEATLVVTSRLHAAAPCSGIALRYSIHLEILE